MDIIITIPSSITNWFKECQEVEKDENLELRYHVRALPKKCKVGDKCFVIQNGFIRGYHIISKLDYVHSFVCSTTGKKWGAGYYIIRKGKFYELNQPVPMKGFQGFRYINFDDTLSIIKIKEETKIRCCDILCCNNKNGLCSLKEITIDRNDYCHNSRKEYDNKHHK
jgi:hypothetical protein